MLDDFLSCRVSYHREENVALWARTGMRTEELKEIEKQKRNKVRDRKKHAMIGTMKSQQTKLMVKLLAGSELIVGIRLSCILQISIF
jgi:hypothetical protein